MDAYAKKRFICDMVTSMEKVDMVNIYYFLKKQNLEDRFFNKVSNGVKINLDSIPETALNSLHGYVQFIVSAGLPADASPARP